MADNGDAANQSEAIRDAVEYYAQELGYTNGRKIDTNLRWVLRQVATIFICVGLGFAAAFYFAPVAFRVASVAPVLGGLVCLGAEKALARHEPAVSNRLKRVFRREKA